MDIQERVQVEHRQGELRERLVAEELERRRLARPSSAPGPTASQKARSTICSRVAAGSRSQPLGERRGQVVREPAVEQFQRLRGVRARLRAGRNWSAAPGRRTPP